MKFIKTYLSFFVVFLLSIAVFIALFELSLMFVAWDFSPPVSLFEDLFSNNSFLRVFILFAGIFSLFPTIIDYYFDYD